jgi:hypothetical protein
MSLGHSSQFYYLRWLSVVRDRFSLCSGLVRSILSPQYTHRAEPPFAVAFPLTMSCLVAGLKSFPAPGPPELPSFGPIKDPTGSSPSPPVTTGKTTAASVCAAEVSQCSRPLRRRLMVAVRAQASTLSYHGPWTILALRPPKRKMPLIRLGRQQHYLLPELSVVRSLGCLDRNVHLSRLYLSGYFKHSYTDLGSADFQK